MANKEKQKNWFRRHWIITIFLVLLAVGFITSLVPDEAFYPTNPDNKPLGSDSNSASKGYVEEDLYTLIALFVSSNSPYTDLQKEEMFEAYKDKWIRSSAVVKEIDEGVLRGLVVRVGHPDNSLLNGATLYFKDSEKDKLLGVGMGEEITFEGKIMSYSDFIGIMVEDAELR